MTRYFFDSAYILADMPLRRDDEAYGIQLVFCFSLWESVSTNSSFLLFLKNKTLPLLLDCIAIEISTKVSSSSLETQFMVSLKIDSQSGLVNTCLNLQEAVLNTKSRSSENSSGYISLRIIATTSFAVLPVKHLKDEKYIPLETQWL